MNEIYKIEQTEYQFLNSHCAICSAKPTRSSSFVPKGNPQVSMRVLVFYMYVLVRAE